VCVCVCVCVCACVCACVCVRACVRACPVRVLTAGTYGMIDAIQPAVSYNLGAKNKKKIMDLFRIACWVAGTISLVSMTIMLLFPETLARIFTKIDDIQVIELTVSAIYLFAPSYVCTWFLMVSSSFLTSLDKPKESLIIMIFRAIVFPLISLILMTRIMGVYGVFITPTVAGTLTMIIALIIWIKTVKALNRELLVKN